MDPYLHMIRALIRTARGDLAGALEEDEVQFRLAHDLDPQSAYPAFAYSSFIRATAGDRDTASERLDELLRRWRTNSWNVGLNPSELAFAAVLLERQRDFLACAEEARTTRWLDAARAFARGEHAQAAELFHKIGSQPNEAYARLAAGDEANLRRALEFYRSVDAKLYIARAEALLLAAH